jgi:hypothetical protein
VKEREEGSGNGSRASLVDVGKFILGHLILMEIRLGFETNLRFAHCLFICYTSLFRL